MAVLAADAADFAMSQLPLARFKRRTPFGGFRSTGGLAKRARVMNRRVQQGIARMARSRAGRFGAELKFLDCAWNTVAINTSTDGSSGEVQPSTGCTGAMSVPAQGDGESNRDGRKYTIKSVWVSGVVNTSALADQADAQDDFGTFAALVLDTQANGATIVSENVFLNPGTSAAAILPQPVRNLQNSKRFRVLASKYIQPGGMYSMTDGASTGSLANQVAPTFSLSWKGNIVCDSIGTTADVASASDNAIHLIMFSGGGTTKTFIGKSRMRFYG